MRNTDNAPKFISMLEASKLCAYSQEYLSLLARRGKLFAKKLGRNWFTTREALDEYLKKQSVVISLPKTFFAQSAPTTLRSDVFGKPVLVSSPTSEEEDLTPRLNSQKIQQESIPEAPAQVFEPHVRPEAPYEDTNIAEVITELANTSKAQQLTEASVVEKLDKLSESLDVFAGRITQSQPVQFTPRVSSWYSRPRRSFLLMVGAIVLLFLLVGGFGFGRVDDVLAAVRKALNDAETLGGHFPGTHTNEVLLLDKSGNISIFGHIETQGQLRSYAPDGVAPIVVDSVTKVENLNADFLDDLNAKDFTLAFVTSNGNLTTEDVFLEGNVEVGKTLTVKGATKLRSNLDVYGNLGVFGNAVFTKEVTLTSGNLGVEQGNVDIVKGNLLLREGTIEINNTQMVRNLNSEYLQGLRPSNFTLDFVVSNGDSTDRMAFFNSGLFGANGAFTTLGVSGSTAIGSSDDFNDIHFSVYSKYFRVDEDGNISARDFGGDDLSLGGYVKSDLVPSGSYDLGSTTQKWRALYVSSASFSGSVNLSGTSSESFRINTDNVSSDSEDSYLAFERGVGSTSNATLKWNSTGKRFEFNEPVFISSSSLTTFSVSGGPSSLSNTLYIEHAGNVGIGTTSPTAKLDVIGTVLTHSLNSKVILLASSSASLITPVVSYQGYTNFSGGIGTGGTDSVPAALRLTNAGRLINISAIQAGETLLNRGGTFASTNTYSVGSSPVDVVAADVNKDVYVDMVVANSVSHNVSVLLNNGDGTFASAANYSTGTNPYYVAVADIDGDGARDIVAVNGGASSVSVLLNNGDGTFATQVTYNVGSTPRGVALGDVNSDGYPDIAVGNVIGGSVSVLLNNGDGTFATQVTYSAGTQPFGVAIGDVNGDGYSDIVASNFGSANVSVLLNNGDGTFAAAANYSVGTRPYSVVLADMNNDGYTDIAASNNVSNTVSVLLNDGDGTFATAANYSTDTGTYQVAAVDINGDGYPDLVASNYNGGNVSVLINDGDGTFATAVNYSVTAPTGVALADVNNDGMIDMMVSNNSTTTVSVKLNRTSAMFYAEASSGNIGIGTTEPSAALDITPTSSYSGTLFRIASGSNERMRITSAGNVGIGTTSPTTKLDISGSASVSGNFELSGYVSNNWLPRLTDTYTLGDSTHQWANLFTTNASVSNNFEVSNTASISQLFVGGTSFRPLSSNSIDFDEIIDASTLDANFSVASSGYATTWNGNFYHLQGNLGIGTTNPTSLLHIVGDTSTLLNVASGSSSKFTVLENGNIGIGTDTPVTKLEVQGTSSASYGLFGALQIADFSSQSYSRFGSATTGHSLAAADDLLISGMLEINDAAWFDSNASVAGNFEVGGTASVGGNIYQLGKWETLEQELDMRISDWRRQNYAMSTALNMTYKDENKQTVTLAAGEYQIHGLIFAKNYIFGSTRTSPAKLIRFNPDDLSDYTVLTFASDGLHAYADDLIYVPSEDTLYVVFANNARTVVAAVDPDAMTSTDVIDDADQGTAYSNGGQSITSDGSSLFIMANFSDHINVLKYSLADFSNSASTSSYHLTYGHSIRYDGTNLYATGASSPGWVARIDPSDLSVASQSFASGENTVTDDISLVGDYVFVGLETTNGTVLRIKKSDLSSISRIYTGVPANNYGTFFDGRYVWSVHNTTPGKMVRIDPYSLETREYIFDSGENAPNEIVSDGQRLFITFWTPNPAKITRISIPNLDSDSGTFAYVNTVNGRKFMISSSGNVAIGTTSPTTRFDIHGSAGNYNILNVASSSGTSILHITKGGNIGMGDTSPEQKLTVTGTILASQSANDAELLLRSVSDEGLFAIRASGSAGIEKLFITNNTSNTQLMTISSTGYVGIGTTAPSNELEVQANATEVLALVRNAGGDGGAGFRFIDDASSADWKVKATLTGGFKIRDETNSLNVITIEPDSAEDVLYIDSNGNIGIGTSDLTYELELQRTGSNVTMEVSRTDGATGYVNATNTRMNFGTISQHPVGLVTGGSIKAIIASSGNFGIGTTTPAVKLHIASTSDEDILRLQDSDGTCNHNPESGAETVTCSSDMRLKSNITDYNNAIGYLNDFRVREFTVNATNTRGIGVVAQELQETHPEMVHEDQDGFLMVEQPNPWILVKAIQEQQNQIASLSLAEQALRLKLEDVMPHNSSKSNSEEKVIISGGIDILGILADVTNVVVKTLHSSGDIVVGGIKKTAYSLTTIFPTSNIASMIKHWTIREITIDSTIDNEDTALFRGTGAKAAEQSKLDLDEDESYLATYGVDSTRGEIYLSGTSELIFGEARVFFDFSFTSVISENAPIRIVVTPATSAIRGQLYIDAKNQFGFVVRELNGASTGMFDWLVIARRKGYEDQETNTSELSPTPSPTVMPLPSIEPTVTVTPAPTETSTPIPDVTETPTPSVSESPIPTPEVSVESTPQPSETVTPLPIVTPSPSPSETPQPSLEPSPSPSELPVPTETSTPDVEQTPEPSPSGFPSPSPSETPTSGSQQTTIDSQQTVDDESLTIGEQQGTIDTEPLTDDE